MESRTSWRKPLVRYVAAMLLLVGVLWLLQWPVLTTMLALAIMAFATVRLLVDLIRKPGRSEVAIKSWWRLFWDGFWGLG